jgi:hypothetical protein
MDSMWPYANSGAKKYREDTHFRVLVDTFTSLLWGGKYTPSELREASILAATQLEAIRIRPLIFDPNNYEIENGVLDSLKEPTCAQ